MVSLAGGGAWTIIPTLGFFYGLAIIRVARAAAIQIAARDFVTSARARGETLWTIALHEVLPNISDLL
jgi:peptide/nickel transport system permease protein